MLEQASDGLSMEKLKIIKYLHRCYPRSSAARVLGPVADDPRMNGEEGIGSMLSTAII